MATIVRMTAYLGWYRDTAVECDVEVLECGAGRVTCFECGGTGDWSKFYPEPVPVPCICVQCKGTGKQLISIY